MIEAFLLKLRARDVVSDEEQKAIESLFSEVREIPSDKTLIRAGDRLNISLLLLDGVLCRYKDLRDGSRQISELHVAGDFADLHGFTLKRLDHSVMTLTASRIAVAPHERIRAVIAEYPHVARLFWLSTNIDAAIHREWVLSLGRRSALSRVAHLFCELRERLATVGLADETGFALALTQTDLAECMGLTPVHVNRTLRELRERGLVEFRGRRVTIHDLAGLQRVAEFDPGYLSLQFEPR